MPWSVAASFLVQSCHWSRELSKRYGNSLGSVRTSCIWNLCTAAVTGQQQHSTVQDGDVVCVLGPQWWLLGRPCLAVRCSSREWRLCHQHNFSSMLDVIPVKSAKQQFYMQFFCDENHHSPATKDLHARRQESNSNSDGLQSTAAAPGDSHVVQSTNARQHLLPTQYEYHQRAVHKTLCSLVST